MTAAKATDASTSIKTTSAVDGSAAVLWRGRVSMARNMPEGSGC